MVFELLLIVFAVFALLNYKGSQKSLIPLACLVGALLVDKRASTLTNQNGKQLSHDQDLFKNKETRKSEEALEALLNNKNVLILTDAVNNLLQDLNIKVSPTPDHPCIDRILKVPGIVGEFGLVLINDVAKLKEDWGNWDKVADFDLGKGGEQRLLIIASNSTSDSGGSKSKFKDFPSETQGVLLAKHVVAMTTLTFSKIYRLCKKKKVPLVKIFHLIQQHPGGVFPA